MEFGAHLPLIDFEESWESVPDLGQFARAASQHGFRYLCANDHLVFSRPWLDGLVALSSVVRDSGSMTLMTTVALPVVRGAAALSKSLAALDLLSGGRVVAGLGPGSSARDYALVGLDFQQRWPLFERAVSDVRTYLRGDIPPGGEALRPAPAQPAVPLWIGSWGSEAGLRRVARLADGWLASAYNTDPGSFSEGRLSLEELTVAANRNTLPNALGTMWMYITENAADAEIHLLRIATMLNRPVDALRPLLMVGNAEHCRRLVRQYARAGVERMFVWPLADEVSQLETFARDVMPGAG